MSYSSYALKLCLKSKELCRILKPFREKLIDTDEAKVSLNDEQFSIQIDDWGSLSVRTPENITQVPKCLCDIFDELYIQYWNADWANDLISKIKENHGIIESDINSVKWLFHSLMRADEIEYRYEKSIDNIKLLLSTVYEGRTLELYSEKEEHYVEKSIDNMSEIELRDALWDLFVMSGWLTELYVLENDTSTYSVKYEKKDGPFYH